MQSKKVKKHVLSNGLTVLIKPSSLLPKVSIQLWYNVGSKDEKVGERGIAHLIEHMIFKGTKNLSECDISMITHKLSGYTNAFTSYDYTGYLFDFPSQQWGESLTMLADCMHNATFKEGHLNSELKAVIQELKMYRDNYTSCVIEELVGTMFPDHPYHYPIIGYKQDLWNLNRDTLVKFYQKHYIPNNATLVLVGDVDEKEALEKVKKEFGHLVPNEDYKKELFYHGSELQSKSVTLYRDIKVPSYILAWEVPGANAQVTYTLDIISWVLALGKGSRLYKKLVNEEQLVTDIDAFTYDLFDAGVFFVFFQAKEGVDVQRIIELIQRELKDIAQNGVSDSELNRAIKQVQSEHMSLLESFSKQAYALGKFYLATGDENYIYTMTDEPKDELAKNIREFVKSYLRPALMNKGSIEPLLEGDKDYWLSLQELSDEEDARILDGRIREEGLEDGCYVKEVKVYPPKAFKFPKAESVILDNGLKVFYYQNDEIPKIDIAIDITADQQYDPEGKEGLTAMVAALLLEGTKNYPGNSFADTVESYGMSIDSTPGYLRMSCLTKDLPKALEFLNEMLVNASLTQESLDKVRVQMLASLKEFMDNPMQIASQLVRQAIYKNHPYAKGPLGTAEGVKALMRDDVVAYYDKYISPKGARLAIVGDIGTYDIKEQLGSALSKWQGEEVAELTYPEIDQISWHEVNHPILRDQTVLCYGALSVARDSEDFDKLLLFDQTFTGGVLGSMASRLFDLREETGLFYTIGGSLLSQVDTQPGLIIVKTIVSNDRLKEAEVAIEGVINTAINEVSDEEFGDAQQAITNSLVNAFSTNQHTAGTLLQVDKYNLPEDYFDTRAEQLTRVTKQEMQEVVKSYLDTNKFVLVRVGRQGG